MCKSKVRVKQVRHKRVVQTFQFLNPSPNPVDCTRYRQSAKAYPFFARWQPVSCHKGACDYQLKCGVVAPCNIQSCSQWLHHGNCKITREPNNPQHPSVHWPVQVHLIWENVWSGGLSEIPPDNWDGFHKSKSTVSMKPSVRVGLSSFSRMWCHCVCVKEWSVQRANLGYSGTNYLVRVVLRKIV